jgi:tripartite-type tricarboxylate transporter receptor subunit TctC
LGYQPRGGTPEDLENTVRAEVARWGPLIKQLGILLD